MMYVTQLIIFVFILSMTSAINNKPSYMQYQTQLILSEFIVIYSFACNPNNDQSHKNTSNNQIQFIITSLQHHRE